MTQHRLFYRNPARCWDEALPIGNGRLGAMIFGRTGEETVELNEDTLWSGYPKQRENPAYFENLQHARALLAAGKSAEADRFIGETMLKHESDGYLPAGKLTIAFHTPEDSGYRRELDLKEAVHSVETATTRCEWLASHPHQVLAMRYRGGGFTLTLDSPQEHRVSGEHNEIWLDGRCPAHARREVIRLDDGSGHQGIRYRIQLRLLAPEGTVTQEGAALSFSGGEATLLLAIRTSFAGPAAMPDADDYPERCRADLDRAGRLPFEALKQAHTADHQSLYLRSELTLPESATDQLPTDERLRGCTDDFTPALAALLYHFGRYLLIASSRPGTQPANLQGIWNPHMLAPWASNYTVNINLEMNYWPAEGANLAECAEPLFRFLRECAVSGAATARDYYRAGGWCLHHNGDLWRYTLPAAYQARWGFWPMGGVWLCRHLFEHYEYSRGAKFLKEYYPVLRGSLEFLLDFMVRNPQGEWTTSPSTSPENGFIDPSCGEVSCVCGNGSAMDLELAREALEQFLEAARAVAPDDVLIGRAEAALTHLRAPGIGSEGQLLEYDADYEEPEIHHRHLSHLYGVYPAALFTPDRDAERFRASEISLVRRGDRSTGWAMGWRLALWARFRNAVKTRVMLKEFLTPIDPMQEINYNSGGIYPNLFSAHPPFQIDANFGVVAGILEMLVQSHRRTEEGLMIVDLLPAIPDDWTEGSLTGVRCRDGVTLDFSWKNGEVTDYELKAENPTNILLQTPQGVKKLNIP